MASRLIIEKYGVSAYGMEDIEKYGVHAVTALALEKINPTGTKSLHVSFDIDSLDTLEAPCTGTSGTHVKRLDNPFEPVMYSVHYGFVWSEENRIFFNMHRRRLFIGCRSRKLA